MPRISCNNCACPAPATCSFFRSRTTKRKQLPEQIKSLSGVVAINAMTYKTSVAQRTLSSYFNRSRCSLPGAAGTALGGCWSGLYFFLPRLWWFEFKHWDLLKYEESVRCATLVLYVIALIATTPDRLLICSGSCFLFVVRLRKNEQVAGAGHAQLLHEIRGINDTHRYVATNSPAWMQFAGATLSGSVYASYRISILDIL
jgi:hypothetical protein